jgi:hypothetical protein
VQAKECYAFISFRRGYKQDKSKKSMLKSNRWSVDISTSCYQVHLNEDYLLAILNLMKMILLNSINKTWTSLLSLDDIRKALS